MSNSKIVQLGRYSFDRSIMIGSGSFGKVYRGNDSKTNWPVCVKVFQKKQEFGENVLETVSEREIQITKQMINEEHENLVKIIDIVDDDQLEEAYMIMELCDKSLKECDQKLNTEEIINFIYQVTTGYYRLEERNIVHRDMKPDNILIKEENGKVIYKLADFGLGKLLDERQETRTKHVGTPYYSAPEIANSSKVYTSKCDIFSFGIIIFELLVGNLTFKSKENREKLQKQNFEDLFVGKLKEVDVWFTKLLSSMIIYDWQKRIGWKELKVIIDLNMFDIRFKGAFGRMMEDGLFFGHLKDEKNKLTVKVFEKEDHKESFRDFQFIEPYSPLDTTNAIKIDAYIDKPNQPLIYVILEDCDCNLQTLIETCKFTSDDLQNFMEQILNGWNSISLSQKQMFSISLQNILVKQEGGKKVYKISHYEFYQMRDKSTNQIIAQPVATIQQFAWIIYQILLQKQVKYEVFQQEVKIQSKITDALKNIESNLSSILQAIMTPESNCKISWQGLQDSISNLRCERPRSYTSGNQVRHQPILPQQNNFAQQPPKIQIPNAQPQDQSKFNQGFQNPQNNIFQKQPSFKTPFQGTSLIHQQPNLQINQQQKQIQPTTNFNPNFSSPPVQFAPQSQTQQNQLQMNNNNFPNPNQQNNSAVQQQSIRFGTMQQNQPQFQPNQQQQQPPQQMYKPAQNFNPNRATLSQNNNQQFHPQQPQPQSPIFQNFNNFSQPPKK